jgi:hypothetical protein
MKAPVRLDHAMTCGQRKDLMPLFLMDALDPPEAAALRAHLATGCRRCAAHLGVADATLAYLPHALDPTQPPASARDRLMHRIDQHPDVHVRTTRQPWWKSKLVRIALPPALAACLTFALTVKMMLNIQHSHDTVYQIKLATAQRDIAKKDQDLKDISGNLLPIALSGSAPRKMIALEGRVQPRAAARAIWDDQRQAWHFFAYNLDQLGPKEAYELWFVTPYGRKVPAATFRPNEMGYIHLVVTLPKDTGPVNACFITDEPAVGTFQPTGSTHLYGKME